MTKPMKAPPSYAIASVDHALRAATMLQLEGRLTVSDVAERLDVARSTAHRLLAMLVYRDFAVQDEDRVYHPGPVLRLTSHSPAQTSRLREVAMPHLIALVGQLGESINLTILTGTAARFIASAECDQVLRVTSREGMVFPAHETTGGLLLLSELDRDELARLYADSDDVTPPPDLAILDTDLERIRRSGFAVNQGRSERGVLAVGVPVRTIDGTAVAGLSVSLPTVRYDKNELPTLVATLRQASAALSLDLDALDPEPTQPD